jgi:hypothetical protein
LQDKLFVFVWSVFAHQPKSVQVSFAASHSWFAEQITYGPVVFVFGAHKQLAVVRPEVASVSVEQKLFLSHLSLGTVETTLESHQLSPVHSVVLSAHSHFTPSANVFLDAPFVTGAQAGLGGAVTETEISTSGGGAVFFVTCTVCATALIVRVSDTITVTVVVDVHVDAQAPVDQLPQSLLQ